VPRPSRLRPRSLLPTKSLVALLVAFVAVTAITVLTYRSLAQRTQTADEIQETTTTRNLINRLLIHVEQAQGGQRGFVITHDNSFLKNVEVADAEVPAEVARLRALFAGNHAQLQRVDAIEALAKTRLGVADEVVRLELQNQHDAAVEMVC
jgi:CHASE3 domain sensor protein